MSPPISEFHIPEPGETWPSQEVEYVVVHPTKSLNELNTLYLPGEWEALVCRLTGKPTSVQTWCLSWSYRGTNTGTTP